MSHGTVVILTEPARCDFADPGTLLQAVLQLHQLNAAGVSASQAFCDHPAAAMKFLEAYAKAYPELQLRSSDLPPPETLYSIVADGGVRPLQVAATPEAAKPAETSQLLPVYVLSLGAPDALMRALKHNGFARRDIQVVEIPPAEAATPESVSVAEAVAQEPHARSWWRTDAADRAQDDDGLLPADESAPGDQLNVTGVEVNLDHIRFETKHEPADHAAADAFGQPAVVPPPAAAAPVDPHGPGAASGATEAAAKTPLVGGTAAPGGAAPTAAVEASPENENRGPASEAAALGFEAASAADVAPKDPVAAQEGTDPEAGEEHPDEAPPEDRVVTTEPEGPPRAEAAGETDPEADTGNGAAEDSPGIDHHDTDDSGDDVLYPPNDGFAMAADVTYPLPAGSSLSGDLLDDALGDSGSGEVVDLEALGRLTEAPPPVEDLFELTRDAGRARGDGTAEHDPAVAADADCLISPEADEESPSHERVPSGHDLDI